MVYKKHRKQIYTPDKKNMKEETYTHKLTTIQQWPRVYYLLHRHYSNYT